MSVEQVTAIDQEGEGVTQCWCCGSMHAPARMVHLGDHPEVHLCLRCAHFVHHQAWAIEDEGKRGPAAFARDQLRNLRAEVMRREWHATTNVLGGLIRWIGRHLP
ncbi:MAG: hypothetical protein ACTHJ6_12665 [Oryzihumus sp.]